MYAEQIFKLELKLTNHMTLFFIYSLFKEAFSATHCLVLNERVVSKL
jgi:hypothetical protein